MPSSEDIQHPFTPSDAVVPGYVPGDINVVTLFAVYIAPLTVVVILALRLSHDRRGKVLSLGERWMLAWFALSGFTHICIEIPFTVWQDSMAWRQDIWSQIWKEYSKADSRYILAGPSTVVIESLTAWILGPCCLFYVWLTYERSPSRHFLATFICASHLYGTTVYFLEEVVAGFPHTPVGSFRYFWFYFVILNSPWIIVPFLILVNKLQKISQAQEVFDKSDSSNQTQESRSRKKRY